MMKLFLVCFMATLLWVAVSPLFERKARDMTVTGVILIILIFVTIGSLIIPWIMKAG